jgi:hypothetical protein
MGLDVSVVGAGSCDGVLLGGLRGPAFFVIRTKLLAGGHGHRPFNDAMSMATRAVPD